MTKVTKRISVVAVCILMLMVSVVPAFASSMNRYENHSVVDCTNRYKTYEGKFEFTIKIPKGSELSDTDIAITKNSDGDILFVKSLDYFESNITYSYSDDTSDYYNLLIDKYADAGVGIKLYCYYYYNSTGICYTATDTANGTVTIINEGRGYWQSA